MKKVESVYVSEIRSELSVTIKVNEEINPVNILVEPIERWFEFDEAIKHHEFIIEQIKELKKQHMKEFGNNYTNKPFDTKKYKKEHEINDEDLPF